MRTRTSMPVALACALLVSAVAQAAPIVVYGSLGPNGNEPLPGGALDFGPSWAAKVAATGFTTGTDLDLLNVSSISLGLFFGTPATSSRTVSIYENSSGAPGLLKATSSTTVVGDSDIYKFTFPGGVLLSPSTTYWVVPSFDTNAAWQYGDEALGPQNASGYAFVNSIRSAGDINGAWTNVPAAGNLLGMAIEVAPVPEPSSIALAGMGIVVAGLSFRRRMRRATSTAATEAT